MKQNLFEKGPKKYEYFKNPERRKDIYVFCKELSTYLHDERIPNIIFIDRSPRPLWVGVDEYWKLNYKNEERPGMFFMNPEGFDVAQKIHNDEISVKKMRDFEEFDMEQEKQDFVLHLANNYTEEINEQFTNVYPSLLNDKEKPIAVFDNCIHSGNTIIPIIHYLHKSGFKDIRVVIGDTYHDRSPVKIDKEFSSNIKSITCGLLGTDTGVEKSEDKLFSDRDESANRKHVVQSREEIRRIVKDGEVAVF